MPLHRAQHVPDPTRRPQASAQGRLGQLFPLIFELPPLANSIARGGMVSSAPRGNGLGPRRRAHAEARQRSSCSSVHARAVWTPAMSKIAACRSCQTLLGCSIASATALHLNSVAPVAASTSIGRRNPFSTIGHALSKLMHLLQQLETLERRLSEASADQGSIDAVCIVVFARELGLF